MRGSGWNTWEGDALFNRERVHEKLLRFSVDFCFYDAVLFKHFL